MESKAVLHFKKASEVDISFFMRERKSLLNNWPRSNYMTSVSSRGHDFCWGRGFTLLEAMIKNTTLGEIPEERPNSMRNALQHMILN